MKISTPSKDIFEVAESKVGLNMKTQKMQKPIKLNKRIEKADRKKSKKEKEK